MKDEEAGLQDDVIGSDIDDRIPDDVYAEGDLQHPDNQQDHIFGASNVLGRDNHGTRPSTNHSAISKLSTLREYVDDTEDYINIMLDDKQNHLLQMGVMLTTASLVVNAFVVVAGVFGMNITIDLFDETKHGLKEFVWTICGSAAGSIFLYAAAIGWCKHKRLLQ